MNRFLLFFVAVFALSACSKDEDSSLSVNQNKVSLHFDEEFQFEVSLNNNALSWSEVTGKVADESIGSIGKDGLFEASKIGTTTVRFQYGNESIESEVTVVPYHNLFAEPFTGWGANASTVKNAEKRSIEAEIATAVMYKGENSDVRNVMYSFEGGKLISAAVLLANRSDLVEKVAEFYQERYQLVGTDNSVIFFRNDDFVIGISVNDSMGFNAMYFKGDSAEAKSAIERAKSNGLASDIKVLKLK